MNKKEENLKLAYDVFWGFFVIGIASSFLQYTVRVFFGMTHITYWDALHAIFLIYSVKLLLREAK